MKYTDLNIEDRQDILRRVQSETGKDLQIIEKDWWVVAVFTNGDFSPAQLKHLSKMASFYRPAWEAVISMNSPVERT